MIPSPKACEINSVPKTSARPSSLKFRSFFQAFFQMGYCPQFGNYFPSFKGREMLELFGRLRGLRGSYLKKEIDRRIKQIHLQVLFFFLLFKSLGT